jgi:predicted molibdopterin-dependent oxidoreductase YjgC
MPKQYQRLTQPLIRRDGMLTPATWDEALDAAALGFRRALASHGSESVGIFSCSRTTNEMNYLAGKMARTIFRNHNIDSCNRT